MKEISIFNYTTMLIIVFEKKNFNGLTEKNEILSYLIFISVLSTTMIAILMLD